MASRALSASWFRWSDGRELGRSAREGFQRLMRKRRLRLPGETVRARFFRFRAIIEAAERRRAARAS